MRESWTARGNLEYAFSSTHDGEFEDMTLTTVSRLGAPGVDGQVWLVSVDDGPHGVNEAALKVYTNDFADGSREHQRYLFEAEFPLRSDPHFVDVITHGTLAGRRAILFDLVKGDNLDALIRNQAEMPVERRIELVRDLAISVQNMHDGGYLHNDIKPQNIMVDTEAWACRLIDMGFACSMDGVKTMFGESHGAVGTLGYQAPEIFLASAQFASACSDLWSLAATCFYVLTGIDMFKTLDLVSQDSIETRYQSMIADQNRPLMSVEMLRATGVPSDAIADVLSAMLTPSMSARKAERNLIHLLIDACSNLDPEPSLGEGFEASSATAKSGTATAAPKTKGRTKVASPSARRGEVVAGEPSSITAPEPAAVGSSSDGEVRKIRVVLRPDGLQRQIIVIAEGGEQFVKHQHLRSVATHHRKLIQLKWDGSRLIGMPRSGLGKVTLNGEPWTSAMEISPESVWTVDGLSVKVEYFEA
jgi:serine/threonine protein kinase